MMLSANARPRVVRSDSATPVEVTGLANGVTGVAAGESHSCAVINDAATCWGFNEAGEIGDGTTIQRTRPVAVVGLERGVRAVTAGSGGHSCALGEEGWVRCWGNNGGGQLGDGTTTPSALPVDVVGLSSGARAAVAGAFQTCAITAAGGVKCWGYGGDGQLGNGTTSQATVPVDVVGLQRGVAAITLADRYACAAIERGGVKCWGTDRNGLLWGGSPAGSPTPVAVPGLTDRFVGIAAGVDHVCVLTAAGGVKCWGDNSVGELGDGTTASTDVAVAVQGLGSGVTAIDADGSFGYICVATIDRGVKCWGYNKAGLLGDGSAMSAVPADIGIADAAQPAVALPRTDATVDPSPQPTDFTALLALASLIGATSGLQFRRTRTFRRNDSTSPRSSERPRSP